jgi:hypothetical protein
VNEHEVTAVEAGNMISAWLREHFGVIATGEEIWNADPRGELYQFFAAYNMVKNFDPLKPSYDPHLVYFYASKFPNERDHVE